MAELPEDGQVLPRLIDFVDLPLAHLVLEVGHHGGLVGRGVEQDDSHAAGRVHHSEARHHVGPGPVAQADHVLDPQLVEHGDQILAQVLDGGEGAVPEVAGVGLVAGHVHVDEDGALLDLLEGRGVDEFLERETIEVKKGSIIHQIHFFLH